VIQILADLRPRARRVFEGGVNDSYSHYRIKLISLFKQKGLSFLIERDSEANPTLFVGEYYERKIITASNTTVQWLGKTPLSIVEEFLESPGQMMEALDNGYRGATTTGIILSLSEIHSKIFSEENDMSTFLDEMDSLIAKLKAMKCGLPDIVQVGLLLARIPKTISLHAAAASLRSMDPKLLIWELVANRLIAEHKTLPVPKPGHNVKSKRRQGRQNKERPDKDNSSSDEETDSKDFAKIARAVAFVLKGKEMSSVSCDFCGKAGHLGTKCFLNPSNPNNSLPDKLREKHLVASSDEKKEKPKKLNHESIEIVAMARSTVPKAEKTRINPPKDSRCYLDSGATCSIFFSRQAFVPGTLRVCHLRPILLADTASVVLSTGYTRRFKDTYQDYNKRFTNA
jgi:gag-polypeptide of LTR copia-type